MFVSTVGGGAMTVVFKPEVAGKEAVVSAVKIPLRGVQAGR